MEQPLRITFVHSADKTYSETQMFGVHFLPVWAYTLASHIDHLGPFIFDIIDDRLQSPNEAKPADLYLYSGMNQDIQAILDNRALLARTYPDATHAIGGPICWSFQKAGRLEQLEPFHHIFIGDGEESLGEFIQAFRQGHALPKIIEKKERFSLDKSKPMHHGLLEKTIQRYYGAVIEVSRGCPFLCEFCDIRVLPDNNRSHNRSVETIIDEIDFFAKRGVQQIILACDNFIGNSKWAETVCDAINKWKKETGLEPSFYTWLTIDIARHPVLMEKLKDAGIDMLFIGVESFHKNSLLETAKVQNTTIDMVEEIRKIQSYGLIVVSGLIFGFDTDPDNIVDITLNGIQKAGLISGDPSLLTALPGTPLYLRMKLSGRLRPGKIGLGGFKYKTNIKYLKAEDQIVNDFITFSQEFNTGKFQFERLRSFYDCLLQSTVLSQKVWKKKPAGFGNIFSVVKMVARERRSFVLLMKRIYLLVASPARSQHILKAAWLTYKYSTPERPLWFYFKFWLFNWSNSIIKYASLTSADFDIGAVDTSFTLDQLVPEGYETEASEPIPLHKIKLQRKNTADSLRRLAAEKRSNLK